MHDREPAVKPKPPLSQPQAQDPEDMSLTGDSPPTDVCLETLRQAIYWMPSWNVVGVLSADPEESSHVASALHRVFQAMEVPREFFALHTEGELAGADINCDAVIIVNAPECTCRTDPKGCLNDCAWLAEKCRPHCSFVFVHGNFGMSEQELEIVGWAIKDVTNKKYHDVSGGFWTDELKHATIFTDFEAAQTQASDDKARFGMTVGDLQVVPIQAKGRSDTV